MDARSLIRSLALAIVFVVCSAPALHAQDLSAYRGLRLGMTVLAVATQAGLPATAAKVVFDRPLLIQELEWRLPATASTHGAPPERDSVAQVLFGFCNGELYRIDERSSINLIHVTNRSAFGLVIFSKRLAPIARAGIEEGIRLARLDAPRREAAEPKTQDEIERVTHAKARVANKAAFRF